MRTLPKASCLMLKQWMHSWIDLMLVLIDEAMRLGKLRANEAKSNMAVAAVAVAGLTVGAAVTTGKVRLGGKAAAKASGASKGQGQCGLIADTTVATRSKSKTFHGAHLH